MVQCKRVIYSNLGLSIYYVGEKECPHDVPMSIARLFTYSLWQ